MKNNRHNIVESWLIPLLWAFVTVSLVLSAYLVDRAAYGWAALYGILSVIEIIAIFRWKKQSVYIGLILLNLLLLGLYL